MCNIPHSVVVLKTSTYVTNSITSNSITKMTFFTKKNFFLYSPFQQINKTYVGPCQNVYNFIHISFKLHQEENGFLKSPYTLHYY